MTRWILAFVLMPLALVGCGKTTEQKVNEANEKISRMNTLNSQAVYTYGVKLTLTGYTSPYSAERANIKAISTLRSYELEDLRGITSEYVSVADRLHDDLKDKDVWSMSQSDVESSRANAASVLNLIDAEKRDRASKGTHEITATVSEAEAS